MASDENDEQEAGANPKATADVNPRDTDHPTGAKQAAENAENDPPG